MAKTTSTPSLGPDEPAEQKVSNGITLYPLRSYLDGEVRRAGGDSYESPRHTALALIAAGLATDKDPKAEQ